jgi:hypothetical protein
MTRRILILFLQFYTPLTIKAQGALNGIGTHYFFLGLSLLTILVDIILLAVYLITPKNKLKKVLFISGIIFLVIAVLLISVRHDMFKMEGIAFVILGGLNLLGSFFRTPQIK